MIASAINDFTLRVIFENWTKIAQAIGEWNLDKFSNITSSVLEKYSAYCNKLYYYTKLYYHYK